VDGVPYLTEDGCWQPLPSEECTCLTVPGDPAPAEGLPDIYVLPVDPDTCAIVPSCAICAQEVDFGRINEARSPDAVFESQLEDAVVNLATADCITLDPAGRLVTSRVADDLTVTSSAIDSPLQNLAIYRQLILTGTLGISLPEEDPLITAARAFGAASDKSGGVNKDMVAYLNQIMGLTDANVSTILGDRLCIDMKEEVAGQVQFVEKCYLDYSAYQYSRNANFVMLPDPAYIPEYIENVQDPINGWFEYLGLVPDSDPPTFEIVQGSITTAVFDDDPGFMDGNIEGFAQAADDTRAVIDFMHSNPLPVDFQTEVFCGADPGGDIGYDVSLSPESGLQVPTQMVDGSEGREFTVTVANAGPDLASGTVTVTAIAANGVLIDGSPWVFQFNDLIGSLSFPAEPFSINLGERTTINWTATATAQYDVNLSNNTVNETTSVKVTGGGGGGGKP
jgi:hypothetical protein